MRKQWYLLRLWWRLFWARVKHAGAYVADYRQIIDQRLAKDERLAVILTDLGTPKEVAAAILAQPGVRLRHKWTWQEILVIIFLLLFGIPLVIWLISFALTVFLAVLGVVVALMLLGWLIGQVMKKR